jgi:hypothetical protein
MPPALLTAAASSGRETNAIPADKIGVVSSNALVMRVSIMVGSFSRWGIRLALPGVPETALPKGGIVMRVFPRKAI